MWRFSYFDTVKCWPVMVTRMSHLLLFTFSVLANSLCLHLRHAADKWPATSLFFFFCFLFLWFFVCPAQTIISIHLQITHCWYGNTISRPVRQKCFCLSGHENDGCWGKRHKPECRLFQVSGALLSHVWQSGHLFLHCCLLHTLVSVRQTAWYTPLDLSHTRRSNLI